MRLTWINAPGLVTGALILGLWEIVVRSGVVLFDYFPAPSAIAAAFGRLAGSGVLFFETLHTLSAVLMGWSIACAVGIALGVALGLSPLVRTYSLATVEVLRPMPGIAFLPLALLLFNFSLQTELVVIIYPSIWPVLVNTMGGVMEVGSRLHDVGRTLHLTKMDAVRKVMVPAAVPSIIVGCRLSMGTAFVMAIIAEMIANPQGLGAGLIRELQAFQPEAMFAYVFFIGVLGIALNAILVAVSESLLPGHYRRVARV